MTLNGKGIVFADELLPREGARALKQYVKGLGAEVTHLDEQALADAILQGKLGGLGCDVYTEEPFGETHPFYALLGCDNVILTPHNAWGSFESRARCVSTIAKNIRCFFGGMPQNRIV